MGPYTRVVLTAATSLLTASRWMRPLIVSALFMAEVASAAMYDAVADFNATGVQISGATWSYGTETSLNGVFSFLPNFGSVSCGSTPPQQAACQPVGATVLSYFASNPFVGLGPGGVLGKNMSGGTITYPVGGSMTIPSCSQPTSLAWRRKTPYR